VHYEPVVHEPTLDRLDGRPQARIGRRQEADERHHQHARIEPGRAVRLGERLLLVRPRVVEDLAVDLVPQRAPSLDGTLPAVPLDRLHGPVGGLLRYEIDRER